MIRKEFRTFYLQGGMVLTSLSFFTLALFCISLALGLEEKVLSHGAPAFLWVLAILTTLFTTPLLLKTEIQEGLIDEILLHAAPPSIYLLAKIGVEFFLLGLPLIGLGTLFSSFCGLSPTEVATLSITFLIGFPALSALGILGGLLTLHARGGGILLAFLILPLALPLLLFALSVLEMTRLGLDSSASFCLLTSVSILLVILSVGAGNWALRFAVEG